MDWIHMAHDMDEFVAVVDTRMNFRVLPNVGNFLNNSGTVSFSRRTPLNGVTVFLLFISF
jgi:hypothetical protein